MFLTRIGLATSGAVALAGCSGLSGNGESGSGNSGSDATTSSTDSETETGGGESGNNDSVDTSSLESEVTNTLDGAVELRSHSASVDDGTFVVDATVEVVDADAIDGSLYLRSTVSYSKISVGTDIDVLREFESGEQYDLRAQFPSVDPTKVRSYTITLEAAPEEDPEN